MRPLPLPPPLSVCNHMPPPPRRRYDYVTPCFPPEWDFFNYYCRMVHRQYENQVLWRLCVGMMNPV